MIHRLYRDLARAAVPALLGVIVLALSEPLALLLGLPALAPAGTLAGMALCGVALSHPLRRLLLPYVDLGQAYRRAIQSPEGAGRVFAGVCIVLAALLLVLGGSARANELPPNAVRYLPVLQAEQRAHWPDMPMPSALAAQVEQETCITLRHSRCWSPYAELRTHRERGVGLGQITRTARFDSLSEMRALHPRELGAWSWDSPTLYDPALQLRALVLMDRRNWRAVQGARSEGDRLAFVLAAYNGGLGGLVRDRAWCSGTPGCDSGRWFGHVERTCAKAKTAAPGYSKSFCDINREYPRNILTVRRAKYVPVLGA